MNVLKIDRNLKKYENFDKDIFLIVFFNSIKLLILFEILVFIQITHNYDQILKLS